VVDQLREQAEDILNEQAAKIEQEGGKVAGKHLRIAERYRAQQIVKVAEDIGAGLIVMGSRGLGGVRRALMGSVSDSVCAPCPLPGVGGPSQEGTGGVVTRSYVTNLRKGRIESPGYEKLAAMAKAMGFPPEVWFDERLGEGRSIGKTEESRGVAGRLEHLFEVVRNPKTGEPYTNAEVARMTLGDLSEEDVEKIRTGAVSDPTVGQVAALASVFGVEPSYVLNRGNHRSSTKNSCRRYGMRTCET
jgi:transcriptional regulator with XRE-family HTH domain